MCGGAPGGQLHPIPSEHYWWSLMFFIHFGLLKQPPAGQQKEKEQVFCVPLEHYRSCLKLLEHSIEPMTKMMTYCSQSTPFQGWATPTLAQENKHCQRHNGPGGWVHFAKVTFHLQNLAYASTKNLNQTSASPLNLKFKSSPNLASESQPRFNFMTSTKHQR